MLRNPTGAPGGTSVTFMEYAAAVAGMSHGVCCGIGKLREVPPSIGGPPKGPLGLRVSTKRQGATVTSCSACEKMASTVKDCVIGTEQEPVPKQAPPQPPKTHPWLDAAFSVTWAPEE